MQLAPEDTLPGEEGLCGKLRCSMYGTRDAAMNWYEEYSGYLMEMGFKQGNASPCTFYRKQKKIRTYVHGGEYVNIGLPHNLEWMKRELETKYQVKTQVLGAREAPTTGSKDSQPDSAMGWSARLDLRCGSTTRGIDSGAVSVPGRQECDNPRHERRRSDTE